MGVAEITLLKQNKTERQISVEQTVHRPTAVFLAFVDFSYRLYSAGISRARRCIALETTVSLTPRYS